MDKEKLDYWGRTREEKYRQELEIPNDKPNFEFQYTVPSLDWYETKKVVIKPTDYYYFKLSFRYGPSVHLIGSNPINESPYWKDEEIGEISYDNRFGKLKEFIEWAKCGKGNRITNISAISGSMDIFKYIKEIVEINQ